jgi:hypothetical protein
MEEATPRVVPAFTCAVCQESVVCSHTYLNHQQLYQSRQQDGLRADEEAPEL